MGTSPCVWAQMCYQNLVDHLGTRHCSVCVWKEERLRDRLTSSSPSRTTSNHFLGGSAAFLPFFAPDDDPSPASETRAFFAAGPAGTDASPLLPDASGWSAVGSRGSKTSDLRLGGIIPSTYTRWGRLKQSDGQRR